jgi:hypothetical protein
MDDEIRVFVTLQTLDETRKGRQACKQRVRPRATTGTHGVWVVWPVVAVRAREEHDVLNREDERVEFIGDEEGNELGV